MTVKEQLHARIESMTDREAAELLRIADERAADPLTPSALTFSITNARGARSSTTSKKWSTCLERGSSGSMRPITENPWHGGPPITSDGLIPCGGSILSTSPHTA